MRFVYRWRLPAEQRCRYKYRWRLPAEQRWRYKYRWCLGLEQRVALHTEVGAYRRRIPEAGKPPVALFARPKT